MKQLLDVIPREHRVSVVQFWSSVRTTLGELERANRRLTDSPPIQRPGTSNSIRDIREIIDRAVRDVAVGVGEVSDTLEKIWNLDHLWVQEFLEGQPKTGNGLGCWLSTLSPAHRNGYVKVNLRNTRRPPTGDAVIGCNPFLHQLAVVAKGQGLQLLMTGRGKEVSHLCHNGSCFNPDHLVVEDQRLNHSRQRCAGTFEVQCPCGTAFNPCPHREEDPMRFACILPIYKLTQGEFHEMGPNGPFYT